MDQECPVVSPELRIERLSLGNCVCEGTSPQGAAFAQALNTREPAVEAADPFSFVRTTDHPWHVWLRTLCTQQVLCF